MSGNNKQQSGSGGQTQSGAQTQNGRQPQGGGFRQGGPMGMMQGGEKSKDFKGTMGKLLGYISPFRLPIIFVIFFAVFSTVFSIAGPKLLGNITTKLFEGAMTYEAGAKMAIDFQYITRMILILIGLYVISALFGYAQNFIMSGVSMKITYQLRKDISEKINRLPLSYFDGKTHGEALSRITNDVDTVSQTLNQSMMQIITSFTMVAGVLVMMISINWMMTLTAMLMIPLSTVLITLIVKQSQKHFKNQQKYLGQLNGHVEEFYAGHNVMQAYNKENEAMDTFDQYNEQLYQAAWKSQFLSGVMMPVMGFVGNLGYVAVCVLGGYLAVKQKLPVGDIQAFVQYVRYFTQPIAQLANISNVLQSTAAAAERVFEFLEEKEEEDSEKEEKQPVTGGPSTSGGGLIEGNVAFHHVHFGYTKDRIIINDFSANIKAGQKVAIVGPTGAGKTTIVKLLMRFYELNGGSISVDGYDISQMDKKDLRCMFGMVLQDTWLYHASIKENIRYGNFDKSDEEVIEAAKAAHCDKFIRKLPGGYDMMINEEANNISQGQKQLLTIARTFLADPPVLILDEATSSVDTRTEALIQKAMALLLHGRTSFVIAHRLSTVRDADLILVMKDGDIIEQGVHRELIEKRGFYAELYQSQFAGADE